MASTRRRGDTPAKLPRPARPAKMVLAEAPASDGEEDTVAAQRSAPRAAAAAAAGGAGATKPAAAATKRKGGRSLADELAALANPAPQDDDPEDNDWMDDNTRAVARDTLDLDTEDLAPARLRGAVEMEGPAYAAVSTSRKELRKQRGIESDEEDEDEEMNGDAVGTASEGSEDESDASVDDVEARLAALERGGDDEDEDEEEEAPTMRLTSGVQVDPEQAQHTRAQTDLWERLLECRIKLQQALRMGSRLPMDAERKEFLEEDPEIGNAYTGVAISLTDMIKNTLELQQVLETQSPINAEKGVASAPKRRRIQVSDSDLDVTWTAVQSSWNSLEPTLMAACDEVHRRATIASGLPEKKQLQAINRPISAQVEAVLQDRERLLKRSHLSRNADNRVFGSPALADVVDPDTYDDSEYYAALLKEFLKASQVVPGRVQVRSRSKKKNVDRKASKGRKLRFAPHPKLVNFMAPVPPPAAPVNINSLFASLFRSAA